MTKTLVDEVPNEATESTRVAIEGIHVFLQITHGVAHSVLVFAQHNRLVGIPIILNCIRTEVHPAVHIGVVPVAFVMHKASGVNLVGAFTFRGKHVTVTRFVTEGPENNGRMVLVALHHGIHAVHSGGAPVVAIFRKVVVGAMAFDVRFVNHVDTILVAQIIHHRVVRVMGHAERIDIETLHENHVFFHAVVSDCTAIIRIEFVAVNTVELHRHAVHEQTRSAVFFLDFNLSKANLVTFNLDNLAGPVLEREHCGIEVRSFGRPALRRRKREIEMHALFTSSTNARNLLGRGLDDFGTGSIVQGKLDSVFARLLTCRIIDPNGRLQEAIFIIIRESSINLEVLNVDLRHCVNINVTHNARKTDKVLVFEPGAVAPAEHLYGNVILALAEVLVDIKFMARESIFTVADIIAVHPYIISGFNTFKVQTDTLAIPFFGNRERTAIMTDRVKIRRSIRCRNAVILGPRINDVRVNRMVIA